MNGFNVFKAPPYLLEKLNKICRLLRQGKKEYEHVAESITDKDLRRTMLTLAQEANQYACELSCQIETLGGIPETENTNEELQTINVVKIDPNEILDFSKRNENKIVAAYKEILNDTFLYDGVRKMIGYQLREMLHTFMQLRQVMMLKVN